MAAIAALCLASPRSKPAPGATQPPAKAAKPQHEPSQAERLTKRIRDDEAKLRTEKDPAERARLAGDIEASKHQLGPRDATGARLQFAAMWHNAAIESLDADYKRLAARAKAGAATSPGTAAALEARANLRRMASACLLRGWTWGGTLPKYQFDAYGAYVANNLPTLDALFDAVTTALGKEATLAPAAPDREAFLAALAQAKDGCAKMNRAAETFTAPTEAGKSTTRTREALVATLGAFHRGLETVCEADAALRELAGKQPKADASTPAPAQAEHPTAEEKAAVEKIRAVAATLAKGGPWENTRDALDRFSAIAEQGLTVERTRSGAQELLHHLLRAAEYVQDLTTSRSAYPEYVTARQEALAEAFGYLGKNDYRQYAYSRLRQISTGDRSRQAIDASPLSVAAAQGLLRGFAMPQTAFTAADGTSNFEAFDTTRASLIGTLTKLTYWPPKTLAPQLAPAYKRFCDVFLQAAEAAGTTRPDVPVSLLEAYQTAATFGKDLERVVAANQAFRAVEQYAPQRAPALYTEFLTRSDPLAGSLAPADKAARPLLDEFLHPFLGLLDLQLPEPQHQRIAEALAGGNYKGALAMFGKQITAALGEAARGKGLSLESTLEARWMFKALRHRCITETDGLAKVGVANLDPLSMPEKVYSQFVAALDQHVRRLMARYAGEHVVGASPQTLFLAPWDSVYCSVGAAQRETLKTRHAGESDLDFLMRNLAQAADPAPPDSAWFGWAVGSNITEAATCLAAGYDRAAAYHLGLISEHQGYHRLGLDKELLPAAFDPK